MKLRWHLIRSVGNQFSHVAGWSALHGSSSSSQHAYQYSLTSSPLDDPPPVQATPLQSWTETAGVGLAAFPASP